MNQAIINRSINQSINAAIIGHVLYGKQQRWFVCISSYHHKQHISATLL